MKLFNIIIITLLAQISFAQVGIGKESVDGSGILDFKENSHKGIILPWVTEKPIDEKGNLIYNVSEKKVMFYDGNHWRDLSIKAGLVNTSEIDNLDDIGKGIIIGDTNTNKQGVLVLNDDTKALILPKNIKPWESIKNPEAGTIAYDSLSKLICIFNGKEWTFWGI